MSAHCCAKISFFFFLIITAAAVCIYWVSSAKADLSIKYLFFVSHIVCEWNHKTLNIFSVCICLFFHSCAKSWLRGISKYKCRQSSQTPVQFMTLRFFSQCPWFYWARNFLHRSNDSCSRDIETIYKNKKNVYDRVLSFICVCLVWWMCGYC